MKKIIILLFLILSLTSYSQVKSFETSRFNFKLAGENWQGWEDSKIIIEFSTGISQIVIYSSEIQIYTYYFINSSKIENYELFLNRATDNNGKVLFIKIYIYDTGESYLECVYSDITFIYQII